ncbi:hypothetical protein [Nocardia seriolae]|uniref:Uncharacterized protein n=2 Tax=Nocardia seriolae TaxID=37332 RepID=A0A0B8NSW4_9NOCA|nr:hypothetical protein [Nocardia seriolae]APA96500.1 hypothetical protein NS506_02436 [Nocardia seriolae]MTK30581.1 hypothetical protein [Nocardia seriolae]MTK39533.1 hypothetical protein [Nocardia seriolae]MTK47151.1 hypothetical protein [Nocardia seriolae]OJF78862.1 hypothetical protein NS14008_06115 [Nocardia seriolae]
MGSRIARFGGAALVACVLVGCSDTSEPSVAPTTSRERHPDIDYSYVWSASPGVDLFGRPAELVRATLEASQYAYFVGIDESYPGFQKATQQAVDSNDPNADALLSLKAVTSPEKPAPHTTFAHITNLSGNDTEVSAFVCRYDVPAPNQGGRAERWLARVMQVRLTNSANTPGRAGIADTDPNQTDPRAHMPPNWDVFGNWNVVGAKWVLPDQVPGQGCTAWWHERFPEFAISADGSLDAPQDWQAPAMPVAAQYPEWIGPGTQ